LLAACGSSTPGLLSSDQAGTLNAALDRVNTKFHRHHCAAAQNAAERLRGQIAHLPNSVNPTVRRALAQGALTVEQYVAQDCVQQPVQTAPATPTPPTTTQAAPTPAPPKPKTKTTQTTTNPGATPPSNAGNKPKNNGHGKGNQGD
jgi:cell division septation protein DedD